MKNLVTFWGTKWSKSDSKTQIEVLKWLKKAILKAKKT